MSKRKPVAVPARVVRQFAHEGKVTITDEALASVIGGPQGRGRGRLSPDLVAAFEAENPGYVYAGEKSKAEAKMVTVPLVKPNARGARLKRPEDVPVAEVRRLAGVEGKRGRLAAADLERAARAIERERGWAK